jgi:DNA-directed RNA polymerase specialized sigma24 family protein
VTLEADFVANRPQLIAVAFRLLGSIQDAEDAVQTAWLKVSAVDPRDIRNVGAWLTTVTTRICLDQCERGAGAVSSLWTQPCFPPTSCWQTRIIFSGNIFRAP